MNRMKGGARHEVTENLEQFLQLIISFTEDNHYKVFEKNDQPIDGKS